MTNNLISSLNRRNQEAQPSLNSAQKEGVILRWPIRHNAAANAGTVALRMFPDLAAQSRPLAEPPAEETRSNVTPIAAQPRYEYQQYDNPTSVAAARQAIASAITTQPEVEIDVKEAA